MINSVFIGLINNVALLIALVVLFDIVTVKSRLESRRMQVIAGLFLSLIGIAVMFSSWEMRPGIIFDTRSILLSLSGVYFGLIPTTIGVLTTATLRIAQGGSGMYMGVGVIFTSALLGLLLRFAYHGKVAEINWRGMLLLGISVHLVMFMWTAILPPGIRLQVLKHIATPVLLIFPIGTVLLGKLMEQNLKRRESEEQIRRSERQLRESQLIAGLGTYILDVPAEKWTSSDILDDILGIDQNFERTVESWANLIYPDDRNRMLHHFQKEVLEQRGRFDKEYRIINQRTEKIRWVHGLGELELDTENEPVKMIGTIQDITGRKETERALQQSEEKFRAFFNNTNDSIFIHKLLPNGQPGNFIEVNEVACRQLGYSRAELLNMTPNDIRATGLKRSVKELLLEMVKHGSYSVETAHRTKAGKEFPVELNTHVFKLAGEDVILGVARDISRRRQLEEEFRQAQKMESIGRLAGGIAHDFNNLLTVINGYSSMLLSEFTKGEKSYKMLEQVNKAGERAARLTNQILAFSRKQILKLEVLNLNTVVAEIHTLLTRLIGEQIKLESDLGKDLPPIRADRGQLEQVIINLAINARDAMLSGGVLNLETSPVRLDEKYIQKNHQVTPGDYLLLTISDTGVGIKAEIQDQIFDPFFTTKEKGKGTGLGLAVVHGIVTQLGGFIRVYSEAGEGATFKIYLPVAQDEEVITPEAVNVSEKLSGTESILVVEDDTIVRELAHEILTLHGYTVHTAGNGEEGLNLCQAGDLKVDLVLTDVVMPQMNGNQLIDELKALGRHPKVIYMSGYTENTIVHHGILEKDINFIQKPFAPENLLGEIRRVLNQSG